MGEPLEPPTQKSRGPMKGNRAFRSPQAFCPTGGVRWRPKFKDKLLLEENQQKGLWQLCGHRVAYAMRQTCFSLLAHPDNLRLAIISGMSVGLSWSDSPLISQLERGCTEMCFSWALQSMCVPTKYGMQAVHVLQEGPQTKRWLHTCHGHLEGEFPSFPPPVLYQDWQLQTEQLQQFPGCRCFWN